MSLRENRIRGPFRAIQRLFTGQPGPPGRDAAGTVADGAGNLAEILGQRQHEPLAVLQKVKHRATGRTRPKPGKTCHPPDQIVELRIHDRAGLRREATCRAVAEGRR